MLPLVGIPLTIERGLAPYREGFCRVAGFKHVSRYITGLLLSPNKTLQGIYGQQGWPAGETVRRRAMHAAVFEAGGTVKGCCLATERWWQRTIRDGDGKSLGWIGLVPIMNGESESSG